MSVPLKRDDPAYWMLEEGRADPSKRSKTTVHQDGCYICEDEEFSLMGLPLCWPCTKCGGHVAADGSVCDACGFDHAPDQLGDPSEAVEVGNAASAAPEIPPAANVFGPRRPCRVCGDLTLFKIHDRCVQQEIDNERAAMDKNDEGPAGGCPEEESEC